MHGLRYVHQRFQSKYCMEAEKTHVPALELWGYTSGTANLSDVHFEHLLFCLECQALVNQFVDVLDGLPRVNPSLAA